MLSQRADVWGEIRLVASSRSAGRKLAVRGEHVAVRPIGPDVFDGVDVAVFDVPNDVAALWAPSRRPAAPSWSTTAAPSARTSRSRSSSPGSTRRRPGSGPGGRGQPQRLHARDDRALGALHHGWQLTGLVLATYQAASGAGRAGIEQLHDELTVVAGNRGLGQQAGDVRATVRDKLGDNSRSPHRWRSTSSRGWGPWATPAGPRRGGHPAGGAPHPRRRTWPSRRPACRCRCPPATRSPCMPASVARSRWRRRARPSSRPLPSSSSTTPSHASSPRPSTSSARTRVRRPPPPGVGLPAHAGDVHLRGQPPAGLRAQRRSRRGAARSRACRGGVSMDSASGATRSRRSPSSMPSASVYSARRRGSCSSSRRRWAS